MLMYVFYIIVGVLFLFFYRLMLQLPEGMGLIAVAARQTKGKGQSMVHYTAPLRALWISI